MARVLDIVEYVDQSGQEMVHRIPEQGYGDIRLGSQLIVHESQAAVFFRDGKALDVFGPGRHTLTTANIPLLGRLIGLPFGGESPFKTQVYFVNLREFIDMKWGTSEAITLRDSVLGIVRVRAFGRYAMQVVDPQLFVTKIVGTQGLYQTSEISGYMRGIIISRMSDLIGEVMKSVLDLPQLFDELSASVRAKVADDFASLGVQLKAFYLESVSLPEDVQRMIDRGAGIRAVGDMDALLKMDTAEGIRDVAARGGGGGGGGADTGLGIGAGLGMGAAMAQAMMGAGQQRQAPQQAAPATPTVACSNCAAQVPADAKFCSNCGQKMEGGAFCKQCGAKLAPDAKFCSTCGTKVE